MALVSPGTQITVTDQSQYVSAPVGAIPLVILATARNKTIAGALASGTTKANAGKLQVFNSQRELATALGYPIFKTSSSGTPLHGNELNEYGLMASYSALGLANRLYAIRADIDLNQIFPTRVSPKGQVVNGTYWLNLAGTSWGIHEWSSAIQDFIRITAPINISSAIHLTTATFTAVDGTSITNEATPKPSIGVIGSYAIVTATTNNRVFYKRYDNTWVLVGSREWQEAWPVATGSIANPALTGTSIIINTVDVAFGGSTVSALVSAINAAAIPGVTARNNNGIIEIHANSLASSTGTTADGKVSIASSTLVTECGLTAGTVNVITTQYSTFAGIPPWYDTDTTATPSGSVWFKTGTAGNGSQVTFSHFVASSNSWVSSTAYNSYPDEASAIDKLDYAGGGLNIAAGTIYLEYDPNQVAFTKLGLSGSRPYIRTIKGQVVATGRNIDPTFVSGDTFTLEASQPQESTLTTVANIAIGGSSAADFVAAVLSANIPNVSAHLNDDLTIRLTHRTGGTIHIVQDAGQSNFAELAGFGALNGVYPDHVRVVGSTTIISGFDPLVYDYSTTQPYANPDSGTLWYNGDATTVDVMISDGVSWRGYKNVSTDARGYDLTQTDPKGVIVSASAPTTQTDNTSLVAGDLWLNTSDLENWPRLSRYNGRLWQTINNGDHISQNGIVFADTRWDIDGTSPPASNTAIPVINMQSSDYIDLDAPDAQLYPRGTLLFNTRRSSYNVKRFVAGYFNIDSFTIDDWVPTTYTAGSKVKFGDTGTIYVAVNPTTSIDIPGVSINWALLQTGTWVTASGFRSDGSPYSGHQAQRRIVVASLQSAVDSNTQIREDQFTFNLILAPGYPELIPTLVALNNARSNTAFVIGDTPMGLAPTSSALTTWSNDTTSDPYLAVYYPSALSSDVQGRTIMVPPSHMALRTYITNDNLGYQWFAPAGLRRGLVDNASDLGYLDTATGEFVRSSINVGLRDSLYSLRINPITIMPDMGIVVWGQKTRSATSSSLDRVNVARLVNYVRAFLATSSNKFLFEPNDKTTRDQFKRLIDGALNDIVSKRGIYDYLVVCDSSNNTPDRVARNELYVDIAISPMKTVEFIYIPIRLVNPGVIDTLGK